MKNLFDAATATEIKERIGRLGPGSTRQWGKMSAAQAMAHCATTMEWAVGDSFAPRMFVGGILGPLVKSKVLKDEAPIGLIQGGLPRPIAYRKKMKSMSKKTLSPGAVHSVPADLRKVLTSDAMARAKWEDITPLARNEWICWVLSVKKPETRRQHIERVCTELKEGMRRPCCWPGCPHR
jgi:hypothetical protein